MSAGAPERLPVKVTRILAEDAVRELRAHGMVLRHDDRLTRDEAKLVRALIDADTYVVFVNENPILPTHAGLLALRDILHYFENDHPQTDAGEPEPLPIAPSAAELDGESAAALPHWWAIGSLLSQSEIAAAREAKETRPQ